MNKISSIAAATLLALAGLSGQAQAAVYTGSSANSGAVTVDASFASASQLFFDLSFAKQGRITLNFLVEAQDLGQTLSFNALVSNLSGLGFEAASVKLDGVRFAAPAGSVGTDGFQPVLASGHGGDSLWAQFGTPGVTTQFYIGNPLLEAGARDWSLDLAGRQVGDVFSITVAVPEPQSWALLLSGLAVLGWAARRRQR